MRKKEGPYEDWGRGRGLCDGWSQPGSIVMPNHLFTLSKCIYMKFGNSQYGDKRINPGAFSSFNVHSQYEALKTTVRTELSEHEGDF
mmetsp:Transcript_18121/g.23468  ORF Transcript_18121/g.23468 Transcript_18121/m.23468 type:complete len:87 (+) Transcript_18121:1969-2229(+)